MLFFIDVPGSTRWPQSLEDDMGSVAQDSNTVARREGALWLDLPKGAYRTELHFAPYDASGQCDPDGERSIEVFQTALGTLTDPVCDPDEEPTFPASLLYEDSWKHPRRPPSP